MADEVEEIPYQVQYGDSEEIAEFLTKDGEAKVTYPTGDVYEGGYKNGLRHGNGTYTYSSKKASYSGTWSAGTKDGAGEFTYPDGARYKGMWSKDKRQGKGSYYYTNGDVFTGDWVMGTKNGFGTYVNSKDGSKLIGTWKDGEIVEGKWEMSGATFSGSFKNGQPLGKGTMRFTIHETLDHIEEGEFVDGAWNAEKHSSVPVPKKYEADRKAYKMFDPECDMPDFSKSNNWMSKSMTPEIYAKYRHRATKNGYTLDMAIQTGVDNPSHPHIMTVGATAGDEETYETFKDLFDPIIAGRHNGYPADFKQPTCLDPSLLKHAGFNPKYVLSSRVRTGRSIRGFCMPPFSSRGERRKIEEIFTQASVGLKEYRDDLSGHYEGLADMTDERHEELIGKHLMFDKPVSPLLTSGGMARDWPDARGVFLGDQENFIIWVNEEDHCRIVSMQKDGNMSEVFGRFCSACNGMEEEIKKLGYEYMHNEHLGYVLACPSNLGTGIRAGVHAKIPLLSQHEKFSEILLNLRLQKRGVGGVDTASEGGVFDLSNLDRLGFSEVQLVQFVCDGVDLICEMEEMLEKGEDITAKIPEPIETPW